MLLELLLVACAQDFIKEPDISDTGECIDQDPVWGYPISSDSRDQVDYYTINDDRSAHFMAQLESIQVDSCSLSEDTTSYLSGELQSGRIGIYGITLCSIGSNPLYIGLAQNASLALFCTEPSLTRIDCNILNTARPVSADVVDVDYENCFEVSCGSFVDEVTGFVPNDPQEDCPDDTGV